MDSVVWIYYYAFVWLSLFYSFVVFFSKKDVLKKIKDPLLFFLIIISFYLAYLHYNNYREQNPQLFAQAVMANSEFCNMFDVCNYPLYHTEHSLQFSTLIASIYKITGINILIPIVVSFALFALTVAILYLFLSEIIDKKLSFLLTLTYLFNSEWIRMQVVPDKEPLITFLLTLSIYWFYKIIQEVIVNINQRRVHIKLKEIIGFVFVVNALGDSMVQYGILPIIYFLFFSYFTFRYVKNKKQITILILVFLFIILVGFPFKIWLVKIVNPYFLLQEKTSELQILIEQRYNENVFIFLLDIFKTLLKQMGLNSILLQLFYVVLFVIYPFTLFLRYKKEHRLLLNLLFASVIVILLPIILSLHSLKIISDNFYFVVHIPLKLFLPLHTFTLFFIIELIKKTTKFNSNKSTKKLHIKNLLKYNIIILLFLFLLFTNIQNIDKTIRTIKENNFKNKLLNEISKIDEEFKNIRSEKKLIIVASDIYESFVRYLMISKTSNTSWIPCNVGFPTSGVKKGYLNKFLETTIFSNYTEKGFNAEIKDEFNEFKKNLKINNCSKYAILILENHFSIYNPDVFINYIKNKTDLQAIKTDCSYLLLHILQKCSIEKIKIINENETLKQYDWYYIELN